MSSIALTLTWLGPFGWPGHASSTLDEVPPTPGVYLLCFAHTDGFLIYAAGVTSRPVPARLREHTRKYESGQYTVLDPIAAAQGMRREIWHGWAEARRPERIAEFAERRDAIVSAAHRQLNAFRIFSVALPADNRLPNRVEAGVMDALYRAPPPFCTLPDRGMYLSRRRGAQQPVVIQNRCPEKLHALPEIMEV